MLTDEEKTKLREEEIFRSEVRASLIERPRGLARVMKSLSTPLGIWFLSSVVLGFGSFWYNEFTASKEASRVRNEKIRRLDNEIHYRLTEFRNLGHQVGIKKAVEYLESPQPSHYVFTENEKRPLSAVLWELHELVPREEKSPIFAAYSTTLKLGTVRNINDKSLRNRIMERLVEVTLPRQFEKDFNLTRWGRQFNSNGKPDPIWGGLISQDVLTRSMGERVPTEQDEPCIISGSTAADTTAADTTAGKSAIRITKSGDLSHTIGGIRDSGQEGATVGFAIAYAVQSALYQRGELATLSARGIYEAAKVYDEWPGEDYHGTSVQGGLIAARQRGVYTEEVWPYRCKAPPAQLSPPLLKIRSFTKLAGLASIREALGDRRVVVASINITKDFGNTHKDGLIKIANDAADVGMKAVTIVAYDAKSGKYKFANDWGAAWGRNGFGYLSEKDMAQLLIDSYVLEL